MLTYDRMYNPIDWSCDTYAISCILIYVLFSMYIHHVAHIYIHIHTYTCIYIHIHTYTYVYTHTYIYIFTILQNKTNWWNECINHSTGWWIWISGVSDVHGWWYSYSSWGSTPTYKWMRDLGNKGTRREDMSFKCLFFAEVITTPIALLIMGCIVRHWRLLILPLFTATWIGGWFTLRSSNVASLEIHSKMAFQ